MLRIVIPHLIKLSFYGKYRVSNVLAREQQSGSCFQVHFADSPLLAKDTPVSLNKERL